MKPVQRMNAILEVQPGSKDDSGESSAGKPGVAKVSHTLSASARARSSSMPSSPSSPKAATTITSERSSARRERDEDESPDLAAVGKEPFSYLTMKRREVNALCIR
jgi:hypothetical protein